MKSIAILLVLSAAGSAHAADTDCSRLRAVVPADQACVDTPHGVVIAATAERGRELARVAATGEQRFELRFGQAVPRYALVENANGEQDTALDKQLDRAGFVSRLPWLSLTAMAEAYRTSITRGVTAQARGMGYDDTRTAALVTAELAQQQSLWAPDALRAREAGTLAHELGHGWFIVGFWPQTMARSGDHYGGPAPDWMDETAALLMEDDALAEQRRAHFAQTWQGTDAAARARLSDLTAFLSRRHPAVPGLAGLTSGSFTVLTGAEAEGIAAVAGGFYLQARLFADYILDRSGDPAAFRTAATAFARGQTTAQWLTANAAALKIPATVPLLATDWQAWLAKRFANTAQKPGQVTS